MSYIHPIKEYICINSSRSSACGDVEKRSIEQQYTHRWEPESWVKAYIGKTSRIFLHTTKKSNVDKKSLNTALLDDWSGGVGIYSFCPQKENNSSRFTHNSGRVFHNYVKLSTEYTELSTIY